jgi:hypothetical protein
MNEIQALVEALRWIADLIVALGLIVEVVGLVRAISGRGGPGRPLADCSSGADLPRCQHKPKLPRAWPF